MSVPIEITSIQPATGKGPAKVFTSTGATLQAWPDKLSGLQVGGRYDVDLAEREFRGRTYHSITKIIATKSATATQAGSQVPVAGNGDTESAFVARVLSAFVTAGKVSLDDRTALLATTMSLRGLWQSAFLRNGQRQRQAEGDH